MKTLIIICSLLLLLPAAQAQETAPDLHPPKKIAFKYRHPKIYTGFRKVRHVCVLCAPIVNVTANVFTAVGVFF